MSNGRLSEPSNRKWPKKGHEQDGTTVDFGVECENQIVRDGYVQVPVGSKCTLGCQAANGEAFRAATNSGSFTCQTPIKKKYFRKSSNLVEKLTKTKKYTKMPEIVKNQFFF